MGKHVTIRLPQADLDALHEALEADLIDETVARARAILDAPTQDVVLIESASEPGLVHRVTTSAKRVKLWAALADGDDVVVPVLLAWLKTGNLTEARGTPAQARQLAASLIEAADEIEERG